MIITKNIYFPQSCSTKQLWLSNLSACVVYITYVHFRSKGKQRTKEKTTHYRLLPGHRFYCNMLLKEHAWASCLTHQSKKAWFLCDDKFSDMTGNHPERSLRERCSLFLFSNMAPYDSRKPTCPQHLFPAHDPMKITHRWTVFVPCPLQASFLLWTSWTSS